MTKATPQESEKELLLSQFTLENLHEAILWIDSSGKILQANDMASQMSGYTTNELITMSITQLNPTPEIADFSKYWVKLKANKKLVFESIHRHKTGFDYPV